MVDVLAVVDMLAMGQGGILEGMERMEGIGGIDEGKGSGDCRLGELSVGVDWRGGENESERGEEGLDSSEVSVRDGSAEDSIESRVMLACPKREGTG